MLIKDSPVLAKIAAFEPDEQAKIDKMVDNAKAVGGLGKTVAKGAYTAGKWAVTPIYKGVGAIAQRIGSGLVDHPASTLSSMANWGGAIAGGVGSFAQHNEALNSIPHRYF